MPTDAISKPSLGDLQALQDSFDAWLGDNLDRVSHHFANLAMETWLEAELAYLINNGRVPALGCWRAILEHGKVDLTLVPADSMIASREDCYRVELKIADTSYWRAAWKSIVRDLQPPASKVKANIAAVFLMHATGERLRPQRTSTRERRESDWQYIQTAAQFFTTPDDHELQVLLRGKCHALKWPHPVPERWTAHGALCQMIWVSLPGEAWTH